MSFPLYKDITKGPSDLLKDDFDLKHTLKIKSAAPCGSALTTTIELNKSNTLVPKLSYKSASINGFTLDKLDVSSNAAVKVETSLVDLAPGLKFEFKGDFSSQSDFQLTYKHKLVNLTAEVDLQKFNTVKTTLSHGQGPFVGGIFANCNKEDKSKKSFGGAFGYTFPNGYTALTLNNTLDTSALLSYNINKELTLAAKADYTPSKKVQVAAVGAYKACPNTVLKIKADSTGTVAASVKQNIEKKLTVVGAVELPAGTTNFKFGVNATLG